MRRATAKMSRAKQVREPAAEGDPTRHAPGDPDDCRHRCLSGDVDCQLATGEAERLQQGQVARRRRLSEAASAIPRAMTAPAARLAVLEGAVAVKRDIGDPSGWDREPERGDAEYQYGRDRLVCRDTHRCETRR